MASDYKQRETVGVEDLVLLPQISEKAITDNLSVRHREDLIYTNIGSVLLVVNPFKEIQGLYNDAHMQFYRHSGRLSGARYALLEGQEPGDAALGGPHIFALAEETYRSMVSEEENQCVIISGESGAGKTEASKHIMQYISAVSGNTKDMQRVKRIILESNPLLEAFGNAKTLRNDNSSRFGKFLEIYFDIRGGPVGGHLSHFLLEKSRVSSQQAGECNFHIFYQVCAGAAAELHGGGSGLQPLREGKGGNRKGAAAAWDDYDNDGGGHAPIAWREVFEEMRMHRGGSSTNIGQSQSFASSSPSSAHYPWKFLRPSLGPGQHAEEFTSRVGIDDLRGWRETLIAMDAMGMVAQDQVSVVKVLCLVLHLGELEFVAPEEGGALAAGQNPCTVANPKELAFVAQQLGVDASALLKALTWRKLQMGATEVVFSPLDVQQCRSTRDAVAKVLYEGVFEFIVSSVNTAFGDAPHALMLGVLDIYGFEIFAKNGFEQFCINYVNEKLQQIFIELTLRVEQEEYVREHIPWEDIKYFDNQVVCDLIENDRPPGLFALMDDVCITMAKEEESVADRKLLDKLGMTYSSHPNFLRSERGFIVKHYAGDVEYSTDGFVGRNKDRLGADVVDVLSKSQARFLLEILTEVLADGLTAAASSPTGAGGARRAYTTAGFKIRQQAADLVRTLKQCTPHYVRTIKSNDVKRANFFDEARVLHQVKYLGLLENVRVRRAGYSYRQYFDKFLNRFKYTCPSTYPRPFRGTDRAACEAILACLQEEQGVLPPDSFAIGTSKVFIRQPEHLLALEQSREAAFHALSVTIQRAWRRYTQCKQLLCLKAKLDRTYTRHRKTRRADSVFRAYEGIYVETDAVVAVPSPAAVGGTSAVPRALSNRLTVALDAILQFDPIASAWHSFWTPGEAGRPRKKFFFNALTREMVWERPRELDPPRVVFSCAVDRVVNWATAKTVKEFIFLTTHDVLYMVRETPTSTEALPPSSQPPSSSAKHSNRAAAAVKEKQSVAMTLTPCFTLQKRIDLRLLTQVAVTTMADTVLVVRVLPVQAPYRTVTDTVKTKAGPSKCETCNRAATPALRRANCPSCGRLCCVRHCLTYARPLPTITGQAAPVRVCPACVVGEPLEPVEDMVLLTSYRTELAGTLCARYQERMGNPLPLFVSDSIPFSKWTPAPSPPKVKRTRRPAKPSAGRGGEAGEEAQPLVIGGSYEVKLTSTVTDDPLANDTVLVGAAPPAPMTAAASADGRAGAKGKKKGKEAFDDEVAYTVPPGTPPVLRVVAPRGITGEQIRRMEAVREERRKAAAARRRWEEEEEREREAQREREREAEHRRVVQERKKAKAAEAARMEAERATRERAAAERREEAARVVAERARRW